MQVWGLGMEFLRHVERTRLLLHVVDATGVEGRDPVDDYHRINAELSMYSAELAERPQIVVANKADLPAAQAGTCRGWRNWQPAKDRSFS